MSKFYNPSKTTPKAEGRSPRKGTAISVAVSKEEKKIIDKRAKEANMSSAAIMRKSFFSVYERK